MSPASYIKRQNETVALTTGLNISQIKYISCWFSNNVHGKPRSSKCNIMQTRTEVPRAKGPKNEMISFGGPQLLSKTKRKPSARFNIVLLYT